MKSGGVDPSHRITRADLAGRYVGRGVDAELERDRQLGKVDVVALDHHFVPRGLLHGLARNVTLAALAERARQLRRGDAEAGGEQLAVRRDVGHQGHLSAVDVLEHHDGAAPGALELEHQRGGLMAQPDRLADADDLVGMLALHHAQETAQTLVVDVDVRHGHTP